MAGNFYDVEDNGVGAVAGGGVQSVQRALGLLELLADAGGELGLTQMADAANLPLPTIHRQVRTLVAMGYVRQLPSRRYALGPRLIALGESASGLLSGWARPFLAGLVEELGETANLSMLDGDYAIYVAQVPSRHSMRMFTEVGRRVHLHCTGVGKVLLAGLDEDQVADVIGRSGLPRQTPHTITDTQALAAELDRVRRQGYAVDNGEQEIGVCCVATAVAGAPSPTAISVSGPSFRLTPDVVQRAVPLLRKAADGLAADLASRQHPA